MCTTFQLCTGSVGPLIQMNATINADGEQVGGLHLKGQAQETTLSRRVQRLGGGFLTTNLSPCAEGQYPIEGERTKSIR